MPFPRSQFDELGLKVKRAQEELRQVRGTGTVRGVTVEVDAENRLLAVSVPGGDAVIAAYQAALADKQPKVDAAVRELMADPRAEAISTFVEANRAEQELDQSRGVRDADDDYYAQVRRDPLGRGS